MRQVCLLVFLGILFSQINAQSVWVIGHRGAAGLAPENTLAAINKALDLGVDAIEIDVQQSRDSVLILMHDLKLMRTTNTKGKVADLSLEELKGLDAGSHFGLEHAGEHIPTLEEVLKLVNGKCKLMIEVKEGGDVYPGIEKRLVEMIDNYDAKSWCQIWSFRNRILQRIHGLDSSLVLCKLMMAKPSFLPLFIDKGLKFKSLEKKLLGINGVSIQHKFCRRKLIFKLQEQGKEVYTWTVNRPHDIRKMTGRGVDGIVTNFPNRLVRKSRE